MSLRKNKNGTTKSYSYPEYEKKYNEKRNKIIWNLQKRKSFYKRKGNIRMAEEFQRRIEEELRRIENQE